MEIYKQRGFVTEHLNESLGLYKVEVRSRGENNAGTSSIKIDGSTSVSLTNQGMAVYVLNEDWTHYHTIRFDTFTDSGANSMSSYLNGLPDSKIFMIFSWGKIGTNDTLDDTMTAMGSTRFLDIAFDKDFDILTGNPTSFYCKTPYSAIGNTDVGIVYEAIGTPNPDAAFPDAHLSVYVSEYEFMGCQGYGDNLAEFTHIGCGDCLQSDQHNEFIHIPEPVDTPMDDVVTVAYNS